MLKKLIPLAVLVVLAMVFAISCKDPCPTCPSTTTYLKVSGRYDRVYPVTYSGQDVKSVAFWEPEDGWTVYSLSEDNLNFETMVQFKPNYPNGTAYKVRVSDLRVWIQDRIAVGRNITLNGTLLTNIVQDGDAEVALWRIDSIGKVYDANTTPQGN
jgi:hypothetical protein